MEKENNNQVMKDITEQVDNIITTLWTTSVQSINREDYKTAFNSLQSIFLAINPYSFDNKKELENNTNYLEQLFTEISSNPQNTEKKKSEYYQSLSLIKQNIKNYLNLITQSLKQLGKWLRVYDKQEDIDILISDQTYGTEETLIEKEIKLLLKIPNDRMIKYFSKGSIHNAYMRMVIDDADKNNA